MAKINQAQKGESKSICKIRVLAIERMLNEGRKITAPEILRRLELQYDIKTTVKTIRRDICDIDRFIPIKVTQGYGGGYQKYNVLEELEE